MICFKCGKAGHIAIRCQLGKGPETNRTQAGKKQGAVPTDRVNQSYLPWMKRGVIRGPNRESVEVSNLWDMGASQSLLLWDKVLKGVIKATQKFSRPSYLWAVLLGVPWHWRVPPASGVHPPRLLPPSECQRGRRYFWPCRARAGFGPATGPTLKTALCHIRALVRRMINNQRNKQTKEICLWRRTACSGSSHRKQNSGKEGGTGSEKPTSQA